MSNRGKRHNYRRQLRPVEALVENSEADMLAWVETQVDTRIVISNMYARCPRCGGVLDGVGGFGDAEMSVEFLDCLSCGAQYAQAHDK